MDFDIDDEDVFSTALGTETLAARDMAPERFDKELTVNSCLQSRQKTLTPSRGSQQLLILLFVNGRLTLYLALQHLANASESFPP